jgi:hypothetical protein
MVALWMTVVALIRDPVRRGRARVKLTGPFPGVAVRGILLSLTSS